MLLLYGANDPIRTDDLLITSELLYHLSYVGPGRQKVEKKRMKVKAKMNETTARGDNERDKGTEVQSKKMNGTKGQRHRGTK